MKRIFAIALALVTLLCSLGGCSAKEKYAYEQFYGVVRFSEGANRLVIYIPKYGEVEIPENDGCCSCFDGHEENEDYSYRLREGDLVKINFRYEKGLGDNRVVIMETYPARFDKRADRIEVLRQGIYLERTEAGCVFSFPETEVTRDAQIGDILYFVLHRGYNGRDLQGLYASGEVTERLSGIITVTLTFSESEYEFLENYSSMSVELSFGGEGR